MREQMRTADVEKRFDTVFSRYIHNLPLYLDFKRFNKEVEVFTCSDKSLPYPEWKSLFTHSLDLTKSVEENIRDMGDKLRDAFPQMLEVTIDYREPTVLEMKEAEKRKSVDELLRSKVEIVTTQKHIIERVDLRRDRLQVISIKEDGDLLYRGVSVYRSKRPVSILMAMILRESDNEKRFQIFSDNTVFLNPVVPGFLKAPTVAWDGTSEGESR